MWVAPIEYRTRGSDDYFSILDHASTTYQLKIKEAIHIQWELTTHLAMLFANVANLIADENRRYMTCREIGSIKCQSRRSAKIAIAAPGTPGDFRRSACEIAKYVAGLA